jgi:SAM-dependent methyltransferase
VLFVLPVHCILAVNSKVMISFTCNICGSDNVVDEILREPPSCAECRSNVRVRSLMYLLSTELFGEGFPLSEFPRLKDIKGMGLSDDLCYATRLSERFDYTNTFYDRENYFDISQPHPGLHGTFDFILASDVLEHIAPPVERALDEIVKLLKPNGFLCISVPWSLDEETREHYPDLYEYAVVRLGTDLVLLNRKRDGTFEIKDKVVFHGGVGATLEMRLFSQKDLIRRLHNVGFSDVVFQTEAVAHYGIVFEGNWSLPLVARKGDFFLGRSAVLQLIEEHRAQTKSLNNIGLLRKQVELLETQMKAAAGSIDKIRVLRNRLESIEAQMKMAAESRWLKLGNLLGVGPKFRWT